MRSVSREVRSRVLKLYTRVPWQNVTVRAAIGTTGANAAILAVNMLTGIITARMLAPVGRGELAAMTMWPQFLGFALAFGIPTSLVFHIQRGDHARSDLLSAALICSLFAGVVGSAIGALVVPFALQSYDADATHAAQWFMLLTPFGVTLNVLSAAFLREGSFALYNGFRMVTPCVTLVLLGGLAVFGRLDPGTAAAAYLLPMVPMMLVALVAVQRRIGLSRRINGTATRSLLRYGLAYYGAELTGAISSQLDRILVVWLLTPAAMGLYVVALSFSRLFQQIPLSISTAVLPKVSQASPRDVIRLTVKAAWISGILSFAMAVPVALLAPTILGLFFGPEFREAANSFVILTVEALIGGLAIILSQAFLGLGKPARTSFYSLVGLVSIVPLLLVLGTRYGLVGAALATVGSSSIRVAAMLFGLHKLYGEAVEARA